METVPNYSHGRPPIPSTNNISSANTGSHIESSRKLTSTSSSSSLDKYLPSSVKNSPKLLSQARTPRTLMAMSGNTSVANIPSLDLNDDNFSLTPASLPSNSIGISSSFTISGAQKNGGSSLSGSTSTSSAASPILSFTEEAPRSPARKASEVVSYTMGSMKNCDFVNDMEMTLPEGTPKRKQKHNGENAMMSSPGDWNQLHSPSSK